MQKSLALGQVGFIIKDRLVADLLTAVATLAGKSFVLGTRWIAEQHGATIHVESSAGHGSLFTVRFAVNGATGWA